MRVVLISHGHLAQEMLNTAEMILGEMKGVEAFGINPGDDIQAFQNRIRSILVKTENEPIIILTDLLGGSPFLLSSQVYGEETGNNENIRIITGMNLSMVLELLNTKDQLPIDDLCEECLKSGRDGIHDFLKERKEVLHENGSGKN